MSKSFREFLSLHENHEDAKKYQWNAAKYGILEIDDETYSHIPNRCQKNARIQIEQAFVRSEYPDPNSQNKTIIFAFNPIILSQMAEGHPIQLSFLLVHEWLWNFTSSFEQNRRVDFILHSVAFDKLSPAEAASLMLKNGIKGL